MKKLTAVTPLLLIAATPLTACNKHDADANSASANYELLNDEGAADANSVGDSILNSDGTSVDGPAADNLSAAPSNAL